MSGVFKIMTYSPLFYSTFEGNSKGISSSFTNGTLSTIDKATAVSLNASGNMVLTSVSTESSVLAILGLTTTSVASAASTPVISHGLLEDITTSFAVGDAIYLNYDGTLTNVKPDLTAPGFSAGYFCVFVGVITKNQYNPVKKDIKLMISVIGQL